MKAVKLMNFRMAFPRTRRFPGRARTSRQRVFAGDGGMVTAETAVLLPVFALLMVVALSAVSVALTQLRCVDAAREASRTAARGDPVATARNVATRILPGSSTVVAVDGGRVVVTVRATAHLVGGLFPDVTVTSKAVGVREDGLPR